MSSEDQTVSNPDLFAANVPRLKQFRTTYPEFWKYLMEIATALHISRSEENSHPTCLNDHRHRLEDQITPVTMVGICYREDMAGNLMTGEIKKHEWHPPAWCFNYYPNTTAQSKNSFQLDEQHKVHTITPATGCTIYRRAFDQLNRGEQLKDAYWNDAIEFTFVLPVTMFIDAIIDGVIDSVDEDMLHTDTVETVITETD